VSDARDISRYRRNLRGEVESAELYRTLAAAERSPELSEVYCRLAFVDERHAELWRAKLHSAGEASNSIRRASAARHS
jgi:hypothetical protein